MSELYNPGRSGVVRSCSFECERYKGDCHALPHLADMDKRSLSAETVANVARLVCAAAFSTAEKLHRSYSRDPLTGLYSRLYTNHALTQRLNYLFQEFRLGDESAEGVNLAFIDLDGFKAVNDTYGHESGDEVLAICAQKLRDITRVDDYVARWGGDEFLLVAPTRPRNSTEQATCSVESLDFGDRVVEALTFVYRETHRISASVGVVSLRLADPFGSLTSEDVKKAIAVADELMYLSKTQGKNRATTRKLYV